MFGYRIISNRETYKNVNSQIMLICPNRHVYKTTYHYFRRGYRCPKCRFSGEEKEVLQYIKTIYNGIILENDKTQLINPNTNHWLELDIWLPEIKKAIEYNGYYHTLSEHIERDIIKKEQCMKNKIGLLTISSDAWKKSKINTMIKIQEFLDI